MILICRANKNLIFFHIFVQRFELIIQVNNKLLKHQISHDLINKRMILDLVFIGLIIAILIMIYKIKFGKPAELKIKEQKQRIIPQQNAQIDQVQVNRPAWAGQEQQSQQSEQEQNNGGVVDRRKQMIKERKQREKQERKRAREYMLDQQKQKQQQFDKQTAQKQQQQQQKRRKQQEYYQKIALQQKKKKDQQFNKWKHMFKVEASGKQKDSPQEQQRKKYQFEQKFLDKLKRNKLSLLEDLSHSFNLPTKQVIDKIKDFQKRQLIDGIFDERGKYLVIQQIEWQSIKNYIKAMGRVRKTDIMLECARILKIPEQTEDQDLIKLIQSQIKQQN